MQDCFVVVALLDRPGESCISLLKALESFFSHPSVYRVVVVEYESVICARHVRLLTVRTFLVRAVPPTASVLWLALMDLNTLLMTTFIDSV